MRSGRSLYSYAYSSNSVSKSESDTLGATQEGGCDVQYQRTSHSSKPYHSYRSQDQPRLAVRYKRFAKRCERMVIRHPGSPMDLLIWRTSIGRRTEAESQANGGDSLVMSQHLRNMLCRQSRSLATNPPSACILFVIRPTQYVKLC